MKKFLGLILTLFISHFSISGQTADSTKIKISLCEFGGKLTGTWKLKGYYHGNSFVKHKLSESYTWDPKTDNDCKEIRVMTQKGQWVKRTEKGKPSQIEIDKEWVVMTLFFTNDNNLGDYDYTERYNPVDNSGQYDESCEAIPEIILKNDKSYLLLHGMTGDIEMEFTIQNDILHINDGNGLKKRFERISTPYYGLIIGYNPQSTDSCRQELIIGTDSSYVSTCRKKELKRKRTLDPSLDDLIQLKKIINPSLIKELKDCCCENSCKYSKSGYYLMIWDGSVDEKLSICQDCISDILLKTITHFDRIRINYH